MQFFDGFFLSQTSANSLLNTSQTPLWVAPLKQENKFEEIVDFLQIQDDQDKVAFIEKDQSFHFQKYYGLKYFLKFQSDSSPVCIFDNHNHALFFWADFLQGKWGEYSVIHLDQHSDMNSCEFSLPSQNLEDIFHFTQEKVHVGNFIQPALKSGMITNIDLVLTEYRLQEQIHHLPSPYILDIDLDFRAPEMGYHLEEQKELLKILLTNASFVTIATSPYFLDQTLAIQLILQLFS